MVTVVEPLYKMDTFAVTWLEWLIAIHVWENSLDVFRISLL